jgi:hypothetical protein
MENLILPRLNLLSSQKANIASTDFYDSTKVELEVLYPRLESGGYLIIDYYGHWAGCKAAVNEYFGEEFVKEHFEVLDYPGIMYCKP